MDISLQDRVFFLQNSHLFQGLAEADVQKFADGLTVIARAADEVIFQEGKNADTLYLIYSGKVQISRKQTEGEKVLATLTKGDYFGEGVLRTKDATRTATAKAVGNVILLGISKQNLDAWRRDYPRFRKNIDVSVGCRRLAHKKQFNWVREDEVVHFVVRKHVFILFRALIFPVIIGILGIIFLSLGFSSQQALFSWVSLPVFLWSFLWGLWNWIDWSNDYYIVTSQRVVWLEKVVATYDSSTESPLSAIRNENVETSMLGRILDFGDVIVFTFIGNIVFRHIPHPYEARIFVQEYRSRVSEVVRAEELESIKTAIRSRLFPDEKAAAPKVKFSSLQSEPPKQRTAEAKKVGGLFSLRFEDKDTITYRKHIFVLFRQAGIPALLSILMIALLGVLIGGFFNSDNPSANTIMLLLWFFGFLIFISWAVYQYVDWSNDIFQVTPTQIFDIDKTPLGSEQRHSAPLENILSTESRRRGILQLLFNYGTVQINVTGQEAMAFEDVLNPSAVQQDIDRRRLASIAKKEADKAATERNRLADFFAAYYNNTEEYLKEEEERKRGSGVK